MFQLRNLFLSKPKENNTIPEFTQDWERLQDAPGWLFFEYGEFKKDHKCSFSNELQIPLRSHAFTVHKCPLWLFNDHQDAFPIATHYTPHHDPFRRASILGELYQVPTEAIPHVDNYRQNGVQFVRKRVPVQLPNQEVVKAFAYVGVKEYWQPKIEWFDNFFKGREASAFSLIRPKPVKNTTHWYSVFTKNDCEDKPPTRCFIGLNANGRTPDPEPPAPPTKPVVIITPPMSEVREQ